MSLVVVEGALGPRHHGLVGAHEGHAPVVHHVAVVKVPAELQLRLPARHPLGVQLPPHPAQLLGVREPVDGALHGDSECCRSYVVELSKNLREVLQSPEKYPTRVSSLLTYHVQKPI